jgi:hypothetical protein
MMRFSIEFPDFQIVVTLSRQLIWSHFLLLIQIKSIDSKLNYVQIVINNNLGKRESRNQIERKGFERKENGNLK